MPGALLLAPVGRGWQLRVPYPVRHPGDGGEGRGLGLDDDQRPCRLEPTVRGTGERIQPGRHPGNERIGWDERDLSG